MSTTVIMGVEDYIILGSCVEPVMSWDRDKESTFKQREGYGKGFSSALSLFLLVQDLSGEVTTQ